MSDTVADFLVQRLRDWGVEQIFGYAGDGINGILSALSDAGNDPRWISARHEEMAAFQACGYAKFSQKTGVCMATSGPGAIHLLNGLYDAKLDHVPVVAIVGQQARTALGGHFQQEVDLHNLFKDVAADYVQTVMVAEQLPHVLDRAMRIAAANRTVTAVIIPADLQEEPYTPPEHSFKHIPSSIGTEWPVITPDDDAIQKAAAVLNSGSKPAILVGQGARGCVEEVTEVADLLGAGVAKALLGKDVLPDTLPFVTGPIGLLGSKPSYDMMMGCDTLLMVGTGFPYLQFMPPLDQARAVQIDIDPKFIGFTYPSEVNLLGDARTTLQALIPALRRQEDRSWRQAIEDDVHDWWETLDGRAHVEADPINPMRLFSELNDHMPADAILTSDSGSAANWYARHIKFTEGVRGSLSGTLATMGPGVPYAIGAKFAEPGRPVIACVGDGAMQMNGMNELLTIRHYYELWDDPRLVVLVLHNNDLNQVTWEMRAMAGTPKFTESQTLPDFDYAAHADTIGLKGIRVEKPDDIGAAWAEALAADRPVVIDALCDPDVPPIPPHATTEQVKELTAALAKGDPDAWGVVKEGTKAKLQEFLPAR